MTGTARARSSNHQPTRKPLLAAAATIALSIFLACASPVAADVYQVSTLADGDDGTCDAHCTLREAINVSNGYPGVDYILIPAGVLTLTDPAGPLHIWDSVFLSGQGQEVTIIDASGLGDRVMEVGIPGGTVAITSLTITGGMTLSDGGGIKLTDGHLSLSDVRVRDNSATGSGGGIFSGSAQLTVKDGSFITRNSAGSGFYGGGIKGGNTTTITDSTISDNTAGAGGGVHSSGSLTISGSTLSGNSTLGFDGGAIRYEGSASTADISNTTIVGNHSWRYGGALDVGGPSSISLNAVTISGNSQTIGASIRGWDSTIVLTNSLIAGDCLVEGSSVVSSSGGNLESPGDTCGLLPPSDLFNVADPMLWPLSHYGGPTPTMLPRPGSPALGNGNDFYCFTEDQRGELRSDGFCDIGAVERQAIEIDPIFVDGFESGTVSAWE